MTPPCNLLAIEVVLATWSSTSCSVRLSSFFTTYPRAFSPVSSSGIPITAASFILGCVSKIASSSAGGT